MSDQINNTKATETTEESLDSAFVTCPCCGKPTLPRPIKPNPQLLDHWLACMVTGVPFSHEYPVYEGRVLVTCSKLTAEQADTIDQLTTVLDSLPNKKWEADEPPCNIEQLRSLSRLLISIPNITVNAGSRKVFKPQDEVMAVASDILLHKRDIAMFENVEVWSKTLKQGLGRLLNSELVSGVPLVILMGVVRAHNSVSDVLLSTGFDENFWQGIELA